MPPEALSAPETGAALMDPPSALDPPSVSDSLAAPDSAADTGPSPVSTPHSGAEPHNTAYAHFPSLPPGGPLNRWSHYLTRGHDMPGAQAMLYAAGVPSKHAMKTAPHVGIASVWWEGNPCNTHLLDLGRAVKRAVEKHDMIGWQFNTVGVSDGITMGGEG